MRIQPTNINANTSFGYLRKGKTICELEKSIHRPAHFKCDVQNYSRLIRERLLHKKENADIILNYSEKDGFYGVITDRNKQIPDSPNNAFLLSDNYGVMDKFAEWVNSWDNFFRDNVK